MKCSALRNPKERWLIALILLFIPSTAPFEIRVLVHARIPSVGEKFIINGFRNKDLQDLLYPSTAQSVQESRLRSGAISHKLRLLRDHGLIQKIQKSYRYKLTIQGGSILTALF